MIKTSSSRMAAGLGVDNSWNLAVLSILQGLTQAPTQGNFAKYARDCLRDTSAWLQSTDITRSRCFCQVNAPLLMHHTDQLVGPARTRSRSCRTSRHCPPRSISTSVAVKGGWMDGRKDGSTHTRRQIYDIWYMIYDYIYIYILQLEIYRF